MKKRLVSFLLVLALALGLCAGVSAAPVWTVMDGALSVGGLGGGQYAFAAWYTVFMVASGPSGGETVTRYTGYQNLPATTVAEGSSVYTVYYKNSPGYPAPRARFVYLRAREP